MAWIESHQELMNHPKMHSLGQMMGWDIDTTIGKLHRFWWWCLSYAPSGDLSKHSPIVIGSAVGLSADSSQTFMDAMISVGWIDKNPKIHVHDWLDYAGQYLRNSKYRRDPKAYKAIEKLYVRRGRLSVDRRSTVGVLSTVPTLPTLPNQPTNPMPECLAINKAFASVWLEWEAYRCECRKPLNEIARTKQWALLVEQPDPVAVVNQSIRNQWQGLFPLKADGRKGQTAKPKAPSPLALSEARHAANS